MCEIKDKDEITIGINPFTSPEDIKQMYAPILERIFKSIGKKAKVMIVKDYDSCLLYTSLQKMHLLHMQW